MKNVIDSSMWIEHLRQRFPEGEPLGVMRRVGELIVPTITLLEVRKWTSRYCTEQQSADILAWMMQGEVVDLDSQLALEAAQAGLTHKLPLADSIIYATARAHDATLWTMDRHFKELPGVRLVTSPKAC